MSSQQSGPQRELVFCHACQNEWYRDEHGLICPECQSDVVEIIEENHDPRQDLYEEEPDDETDSWLFERAAAAESTPPDPRQGNIRILDTPNGRIIHGSFHSATHGGVRPPSDNPNAQAHNILSQLMQSIGSMTPDEAIRRGGQQSGFGVHQHPPDFPRSPPPVPMSTRPASSPSPDQAADSAGPVFRSFRFGPISGRYAQTVTTTRMVNGRQITSTTTSNPMESDADFMGIVGELFRPMVQAQVRGPDGQATGAAMASPIHTLLAHLLPGASGGRWGDYVSNNEAFDRIISELMAHNPPQSTAPGPATEDAISSLPKVSLTKEMIGEDRTTAECGICLSDCEVNEKVTELPCKHWFHFECVKHWLESHDSCPTCRRGIMPREGDENRARSTGEAPRHWQIPNLSRTNTNDSQAGGEASRGDTSQGNPAQPPVTTSNDATMEAQQTRTYRWSRSRSPASPNRAERSTLSSSLADALRNGISGWMGRHGWTSTPAAQSGGTSSGAAVTGSATEASRGRGSGAAPDVSDDRTARQRRADHHDLDNPDVD